MPTGEHKAALSEQNSEIVLDAVTRYIQEHGYAPTYVELAALTGLTDTTTRRHVKILIDQERLRGGKGHRAIGLYE